jgi:hypothetical protein
MTILGGPAASLKHRATEPSIQHVRRNAAAELIEHLREDGKKVEDPKAQALFETVAELMSGLDTALNIPKKKPRQPGSVIRASVVSADQNGTWTALIRGKARRH